VFMDSQNEVFVHFSRFDGVYMVTSQMQEKPIRGDSLQDLVSEFSQRVKPVTEAGRAGQNVVSIAERSRNVVLIHPAAALAALVWSIYLMSDDLVAATPMIAAGETDGTEGAPLTEATADLHAVASDLNVLPEVAQKTLQALSDPEVAKQVADPYASRDALGTTIFSGTSMKAVGLSLSLVALTLGLPISASVTDGTDEDSSPHKLSVELHTLLKQAKEAALLVTVEADNAQRQTNLENHFDDETSAQPAVATEAQNIDINVEFSPVIKAIKASYAAEAQSFSDQKLEFVPSVPTKDEAEVQAADIETTAESTTPSQPSGNVSSISHETSSIDDTKFLQRFDDAFKSFKLTNLDRMAQNELAQLLIADDMVDIPNPLAPVEETQKFDAFDQDARMFLDFLLHTYSDIKVVNLPTEIIFIHTGAFGSANGDRDIYAKSWSFEDGGIISTVGFKSDMAQFDLVA